MRPDSAHGTDHTEYHHRLLGTLDRWHTRGLLDPATHARLVQDVGESLGRITPPAKPTQASVDPGEPKASPPPPRRRVKPYRLPSPPPKRRVTLAIVGKALRQRTAWAMGVLLTVTGALYGTALIWDGLHPVARVVLVIGMLLSAGMGFRWVGSRLGDVEGADAARTWLGALIAALLPIQAFALQPLVGAPGWPGAVGVSAAAILFGLHLRTMRQPLDWLSGGTLAPAVRHTYVLIGTAVALVGWLPAGTAWVNFPALLGCYALWRQTTATRAVPWGLAALLGYAIGFHLISVPPQTAAGWAPLLAVGAVAILYIEAARSRWGGLMGRGMRGLSGVAALALAIGALLLLATGLGPLPTGVESLVAAAVLCVFFGGAAASWKRPWMIVAALLAALVAVLAVPDVARIIVEPLKTSARHALGYTSQPLPLAWYSLTLLPYLAAVAVLERWFRGQRVAQAERLADLTRGWLVVLSWGLVLAAHTRLDDPRPAILAVPIYAAWWYAWPGVSAANRRRIASAALVVLIANLTSWLALPPHLVIVAMFAGFGLVATSTRRSASESGVGLTAALVPLAVAWVGLPTTPGAIGLAAACWGVLAWASQRHRAAVLTTLALVAGTIAALWTVTSSGLDLVWTAWLTVAVSAALALAGHKLRAHSQAHGVPIVVAAHLWFAVAVAFRFGLDDPHRLIVSLPLAGLLMFWALHTRSPIYGAVLAFGLAEAPARRMLDAHPTLALGGAAVMAALPALVAQRSNHPLAVALRGPSAVMATIGALVAATSFALGIGPGTHTAVAGLAVVFTALLVGRFVGRQKWGELVAASVVGAVAIGTASTSPLVAAAGLCLVAIATLYGRPHVWRGGAAATLALLGTGLGVVHGGWSTAALLLAGAGAAAAASRSFGGAQEPTASRWAARLALTAAAVGPVAAAHAALDLTFTAYLAGLTVAGGALTAVGDRFRQARWVAHTWVPALTVVWVGLLGFHTYEGTLGWLPAGLGVHAALLRLQGHRGWARGLGGATAAFFVVSSGLPLPAVALAGAGWLAWRPPLPNLRVPALWIAVGAVVFGAFGPALPWWSLASAAAAVALVARHEQSELLVASLGAAVLAIGFAGPVELAIAATVGASAAGLLTTTRHRTPAMVLFAACSLGWLASALDAGPVAWALGGVLLVITCTSLGWRELAMIGGWLVAERLGWHAAEPVLLGGGAALVIGWIASRHRLPWIAWSMHAFAALHVVAALPRPEADTAWVLAAAGLAVSMVRAVRERSDGYRFALGWFGLTWLAARIAGPLEGLDPAAEPAVLLAIAVLLDGLHTLTARRIGSARAAPLLVAAHVLPAAAVVAGVITGGLTPWTLVGAGTLLLARHALRGGTPELVAGLVALDVAAVWWVFDHWHAPDPLLWVGPVALSVLAGAQRMRASLDARTLMATRYAASAVVYMTSYGQLVGDPRQALPMILVGLVGVAAGATLRIRAFLYLGAGFTVAALSTQLLRYGLQDARIWAPTLTLLGLATLGTMVAVTARRDDFTRLRARVASTLAGWD